MQVWQWERIICVWMPQSYNVPRPTFESREPGHRGKRICLKEIVTLADITCTHNFGNMAIFLAGTLFPPVFTESSLWSIVKECSILLEDWTDFARNLQNSTSAALHKELQLPPSTIMACDAFGFFGLGLFAFRSFMYCRSVELKMFIHV